MNIVHNCENRSERNKFKNSSLDEPLFFHRNNKKIWILGSINTQTKEFCIEHTHYRSSETIKIILILVII